MVGTRASSLYTRRLATAAIANASKKMVDNLFINTSLNYQHATVIDYSQSSFVTAVLRTQKELRHSITPWNRHKGTGTRSTRARMK